MAQLPDKIKEILEKNQALIKQKLGDAFYNRMTVGDVTRLDIQRLMEVIRAAALQK